MISHLVGALALSLNIGPFCTLAPSEPPAAVERQPFEEAKQAAEAEYKWLIVFTTSPWCDDCAEVDKAIHSDAAIAAWLKGNAFVTTVDMRDDAKTAAHLKLQMAPTIVALRNKSEFDRLVGKQSPKDVLAWLERIARGEPSAQARARMFEEHQAQSRIANGHRSRAWDFILGGKPDEAASELVDLWRLEGHRSSTFEISQLLQMDGSEGARRKIAALRDEYGKDKDNAVDHDGLFSWFSLNRVLRDDQSILVWFDEIRGTPPGRAVVHPPMPEIRHELERVLIENRRWVDLASLYDNPTRRVEDFRALIEDISRRGGLGPEQATTLEEHGWREFRGLTSAMYAGLLQLHRDVEAKAVADLARRIDNSGAMLVDLVSAAVLAGEVRNEHLEWLNSAGPKELSLETVRASVKEALAKKLAPHDQPRR